MPRKKGTLPAEPLPEEGPEKQIAQKIKKSKVRPDEPFPEIPLPPSLDSKVVRSALELKAQEIQEEFDLLDDATIDHSMRALLWPFRQKLINNMLFFAGQKQNLQVAARINEKLIERLWGKPPTNKNDAGDGEEGLAVGMRPDMYIREDDIPDGTERPEGYDGLDEDEAELIREDMSIDDEDEEEDDEDEEDDE